MNFDHEKVLAVLREGISDRKSQEIFSLIAQLYTYNPDLKFDLVILVAIFYMSSQVMSFNCIIISRIRLKV